jgi:hypothetical protein
MDGITHELVVQYLHTTNTTTTEDEACFCSAARGTSYCTLLMRPEYHAKRFALSNPPGLSFVASDE